MSVTRARQLRRQLSLPEGLLWRELRARPGGFKFRHQHPLGPYVLDFFCCEAGLALEVDGISHEMGDNPQRDERRDRWLAGKGVMTLRVTAVDVLREMEAVLRLVVHLCRERSP
ncbi:MAG TPA: endonuclease domain-containing protein [Allosphingosinicella sp.]